MNLYILLTAVLMFILGVIWTKKDFLNFVVKLIFICMAIVGAILYLEATGYIIKQH